MNEPPSYALASVQMIAPATAAMIFSVVLVFAVKNSRPASQSTDAVIKSANTSAGPILQTN